MNYNAFIIVTSKHGPTTEDEQSHSVYSCCQSTSTKDNTGDGHETISSGDVPGAIPDHGTHDQSRTVVNTAPSLGDQGVKCARIVAVDEVQDSGFHFPGPEGNEENHESNTCSSNSEEYRPLDIPHQFNPVVDNSLKEDGA